MNCNEAYEKMFDRNYFGMMMVDCGMADALITGVYTKYSEVIQAAKDVIGVRKGLKNVAAMHILNTKKGMYFLADTHFNRHPDTDTLIDIAKLTYNTVKYFIKEPVMAMLSYSNFGSDKDGSAANISHVISTLHKECPEMLIDGEMQVNFALNKKLRDKKYPFTKICGKDVNTLIFPNLSSAYTAHNILVQMGIGESIGPVQMGLNKPVHILDVESSVRSIVNMTAFAVVDAILSENNK
jgi:malate dehydrogenase (oxaloacetate-decarboxylating)(NADP+)